ncbi:hypothetical protein CMO91_02680 [Candidatus Woesearchaeota archaeon]|jgi:hypothetical protein|nr:hypothetical protein [Candidatus Woesearchaeota archaeon]|tara:strand:+ start:2594 stop:2998 length:405 start_codon:yes stop_codon:yes gene_type:complete
MAVNYVAVLVSAIASMAVGFVWYSPGVFGRQWMHLTGITKKDVEKGKANMPQKMVVALIAQLVMAYALSLLLTATSTVGAKAGAKLAALVWLGFVATILLGSVLWEGKPSKLWILNSAQWLVAMAVMGAILAAW